MDLPDCQLDKELNVDSEYDSLDGTEESCEDAANNRGVHSCDTCDREFLSHWQYQKHVSEHRTCNIDGCVFTAHEKIVEKHIQMQHITGLYDRIRNLVTPEDISKWRADRKKKYPTLQNIEKQRRQQQEMQQRGERLQKSKSCFDKHNRTRFTLNRQNRMRQQLQGKKKKPTKRNHLQKENKQLSLIDEKADWNGTLCPFRGISQLYNEEEPAEEQSEFDDNEWAQDAGTSSASKKVVLKNALGTLMSAYNSSDEEPEASLPVKVSETADSLMTGNHKEIEIRTAAVENEQLSDDEPPKEEKIERLEVPAAFLKCETLTQQVEPDCSKVVKGENVKQDRKRKRRGKQVPKFKKENSNKSSEQQTPACSLNSYKKRRVTLLERLLENEIIHERNVLLQCVRYVVANGFFDNETKNMVLQETDGDN